MFTTKIIKQMNKTAIKTVKVRSLTSILRDLGIGDTIKIDNNILSVKSIVCRLNKEGYTFVTSTKGLEKGIKVKREK